MRLFNFNFSFIFLLLMTGGSAQAQPCLNLESCEYYMCLNEKMQCSQNNFLVTFGLRYCRTFEYLQPQFSVSSQTIIENIRSCLIYSLQSEVQASCSSVRALSMEHHIDCYVSQGFCQMPFEERLIIYKQILGELQFKDVRNVASEVQRLCAF